MENVDFKELKELILSNNGISDIEVFNFTRFDKLETLNLNETKIKESKCTEIIELLKSKIHNFYYSYKPKEKKRFWD